MDFIQDVLKKARDEGKIDPDLLPWDASNSDTAEEDDTKIAETIHYQSSLQQLNVPKELSNDFQRIIENIRIAAKEIKLQVIGMVSAVPNEGTSTVAAMMALMTAGTQNGHVALPPLESKKKGTKRKGGVLLIDAQIRHPSLHIIFGQPRDPGLMELLTDESILHAFIKNRSHSALKLLTAGAKAAEPATQIDSQKFKSLLDVVRREFEFVFLDIPPLLRYAEGIAFSKLCDGVVLVVRAGQTRWEIVEEAKRLLDKAEVNILGGVLNRREFFIPAGVYRRL